MFFIVPFLLTFSSFVSYSYLLGTYSFIHKNMTELFQISKTELGVINGILGLTSTLGVVLFLFCSTYIKPKIITYYTWSCIGYMFPYALIVLCSIVSQTPSKIVLYIVVIMMGIFRSILFPSCLYIVKIHKQIYDKQYSNNPINEHSYKLLTQIWSVSFDVGMVIGFFGCNWLEYSMNLRWEFLVIIGISFMLITTTLLFFGLRSYMEDHDHDQQNLIIQTQVKTLQNMHSAPFQSFFIIINQYLPSKLFLINSTIIDTLHLAFCFILPAFFFDSGYKGNEGYLTSIYSLFVVFGAWLLAISDYVLQKVSQKMEKERKNIKQEIESKDQAIFSFAFSVSLFFFALTLIILTILSFQSSERRRNGLTDESNLTVQMILMISLGLFYGGPLKSYFSYRSIKAMEKLELYYQREIKTNLQLIEIEEKAMRMQKVTEKSMFDMVGSHKLQIGISLLTMNRILTHFSTVIVYIISFHLLQKYISYAMAFLALLGVFGFIFDIIQNIVAVKYEKMEENLVIQDKDSNILERKQKL